ncbi:response regulator [Flavobacterium cerinum]|uniref:Response regulator n=1 Tax=Flavobacterium cerinum TaxID=2502784 RepID=A0A444H6B4_9FLAO|nr:response regulator [Flavobacterium cerinum]RWW98763.1 response regulator [Flavobacterium cerinum]
MRTILFVDDDQDDQLLFQEALSEADSTAVYLSATDGVDLFEKLNTGKTATPDLIFMDINMPKMNGIESLKELKRSERFKSIPVIMYSTSSSKEHQKICLESGAIGYVEKPNDFDQICARIKSILHNGLLFRQNDVPL